MANFQDKSNVVAMSPCLIHFNVATFVCELQNKLTILLCKWDWFKAKQNNEHTRRETCRKNIAFGN